MSLSSFLGKPNLKALEAPIRAIVHEVLREQGYASPAEVQAIRDDARDLRARLDQVEARLAEAVKLAEAARASASAPVSAAPAAPTGPDPRVVGLERQVASMRAEVAGLQAAAAEVAKLRAELDEARSSLAAAAAQVAAHAVAAPAAAPAAAAPVAAAPAPAPAPLAAASKGSCKVEGCGEGVRSKGFCSAHYQQWRRGTLKGFVGLDGTVDVDGRVIAVGVDHAGGVLKVDGNKVLVDGAVVVELGQA